MKVTVEVNLTGGGLGLYLVGLPDNAVKESEQRIRAAFENTGRKMSGRKVVVNLAPADLRKEGAGFDLPIAVGILAAMSEVSGELLPTTMFAGALARRNAAARTGCAAPCGQGPGRGVAAGRGAGRKRR